MFVFSTINAKQYSTHNAPGLKNRGLRATSMNHPGQPPDDAALIRGFAAPSPSGRRNMAISVRQRPLLTTELQLQPRYRKCVHLGGGAYIEVEKVRTESLRTKGAYIWGSDVRTCNLEVVANRLRLRRAERRGGRFLQKAIYGPQRRGSPKASGRRKPAVTLPDQRRRYSQVDTFERRHRGARLSLSHNRGLTAPARLGLSKSIGCSVADRSLKCRQESR
jgi:hypothetical protein